MEYVNLGRSGLEVSRLCMGTMGFGDPEAWIHPWVLEEDAARPVIQHALDTGVTFFDTANVYSIGRSEEILGKALNDFARREEVVLATKVHGRMRPGPNGAGLSRAAIMHEAEASLRRLGTDYIDLYIIHRWDYGVPIEETMQALDDLVRAGKVRYIGASAMFAHQFLEAQHVAEVNGWTRFISLQNHYNLLYREEEREMMPLLRRLGVGSTPYSPLAAGRLTRDWTAETDRARTDTTARSKYDSTETTDRAIVQRVAEIAEDRGVERVHVALAWLLAQDPVAAPIVGATKTEHIDKALGALDLELTAEEIASLEEPYVPHAVVGALPEPS
ncbi:aldo/keto reductase [Brachybacterium sp. SGAir0954]|uniref:aldo/keto reductase n=1 Tax=Brachybacterium sp. SGAir0954 TaxID=2571029 RepID=UPI0010CD5828|nr:aldo/keto reductase [Brachybacterium sp. SGAir0954]QCR52786.1 aldo/keto reductase [Brachybacterium sp. SGAir0954]